MPHTCPNCGHQVQCEFVIEPWYDLAAAALLIPMRESTLTSFLSTHKAQYPARYRLTLHGRRIRVLTPAEIIAIRSRTIGPYKGRRARAKASGLTLPQPG